METLAYTYSCAFREDAPGPEGDLHALNLETVPRLAGLGLLALSLLSSSLGSMETALAALYANAGGSCLNARSAPSTLPSALTGVCIRNGERLRPAIDSRRANGRLWYQLSDGRWVAAEYTRSSRKGIGGQRMLGWRSSGDRVVELQHHLLKNGYSLGIGGIDGVYGPSTRAAVRQYQRNNGLVADGIAGARTLGRMGIRR